MEIIYKSTPNDGIFDTLGVQNCYFKHLCGKTDSKVTSRKIHHHTDFEIHFMDKGHQEYSVSGKKYDVSDGHILLIPPLTKHYTVDTMMYESKFSITFTNGTQGPFGQIKDIIFCKAGSRIRDNIHTILKESKTASVLSKQIIAHCIYEILVILLRTGGWKESRAVDNPVGADDRLLLAKNYIQDNIEFNIKVSDVSAYCYLGTKQLTRLFKLHENITPLAYIQKQKIKYIESLLTSGVSLKTISEKMNFSSEYHFNSFYKKYAGITPGAYQKMHIQ